MNGKKKVIIGAQWGDEGKGKMADLLSEKSDLVIRYQGGNNAGHTIVVNNKKVVLHLIPSGILWDKCTSVIAHGVVFDPVSFWEEYEKVSEATSITPNKLLISDYCPVITSYHKILDKAREGHNQENKIGTTGKGIGPAYEDKVGRVAIRVKDLFDRESLYQKLKLQLKEKEVLFEKLYDVSYPSPEVEMEQLFFYGEKIRPYVQDSFSFIYKASQEGKSLLYEGAQGILLDVDYGTYPYVTSSNTSFAGIYSGAGVPDNHIDEIIGIAKAYTTRVGEGPFPTELFNSHGEYLQTKGHEFGATTGRKRRCGWLDLPLLRYVIKSSHLTSIAMTKIDVLAGLSELKICTSYQSGGHIIDEAYPGLDLAKVTPIYKSLTPIPEVFLTDNVFCSEIERYLSLIEKSLGIPIEMVAYGPERSEILPRSQLHNANA